MGGYQCLSFACTLWLSPYLCTPHSFPPDWLWQLLLTPELPPSPFPILLPTHPHPPSPFPPVFIFLPERMPDHLALIYFSRWEDLQKMKRGSRQRGRREANCHGDSLQTGGKRQREAGLSIFEYSKSRRLKSGCPGSKHQASGHSLQLLVFLHGPMHYLRVNTHISGAR